MTEETTPDPPVPTYCDCRDLDGFMFNVERMMASELVALSPPAVIGSALLLWCRAWKQLPAASLPDDDKVLAAFAKLSMPQFRRGRGEILRGFFKASDGRLYHRVLAAEALNAYDRKLAFQKRRNNDAERLRKWRDEQRRKKGETNIETQHETPSETHKETSGETRSVQEGQGQGQGQGQGHKKERKKDAADAAPQPSTDEADLFRRGKQVLGSNAGGLINNLLKAKDKNVALARAAIEQASVKQNPREYIGAVVSGREKALSDTDLWDRGL